MNSSIFFNKSFRFAALASAVALGAFGASSSFAAEAEATTTADVITPISITSSGTLAFGRFAANDTTVGSVIIDTASVRSKSGDVILSEADSTSSAATFVVSGDGNASFSIGLADTELSDSETEPNTMLLATITDFDGSGGVTTETNETVGVLTDGTQTIYVGGILSVGVDQAAGDYSGTVTATVEYN
ncbi:protein of unknown function [Marinobacter sp. LV10R510-11A]|uniref:DUF4402 domain-containing protein n=1 Tax=Marinobacter sp. LV10R510-11A TaxID=1415568 RepID=UPI000BC0DD05|nr:DUF4402 domain-containing protein [Marinobacter sp. LV10R510-11A]SOB77852.1 protein of unknown function [Marinobacter sp. LV10R510-11A]